MEGPAYAAGLNSSQSQAVHHGPGPILVLAGAGSGKTRVITARIARLIDEGLFTRDQILAVTFTNRAAREMAERVELLVPGGQPIFIRTFHSLCAWLLRRNALSVGLDPNFNIYDDDDSYSLLKAELPNTPPNEIKVLHRGIIKTRDSGMTSADILPESHPHPDFQEACILYEKALGRSGNLDFPGLILKAVELLENNPAVRKRINQKFPCVLVDEFQDTNLIQYRLLQTMSAPPYWLCVVGDDDQSIYRFRGAEVRNILNFDKVFPKTQIVRLEENYRSTGHILAVASQVVANNTGRLGKTLFTSQGLGKKPQIHLLESAEEESQLALSLIKADPSMETAILYRTNAQSRGFETAFNRAGIPYKIVGSTRFYDREEIKDALAYLFLAANPKDTVAFRRIINKPPRGLGPSAMEKISGFLTGNYLDRCREALGSLKGKARTGLQGFLNLMEQASSDLNAYPLAQTMGNLIEASGLREYHQSEMDPTSGSRLENLDELIGSALGYPPGSEALVGFLERVELEGSEASQVGEAKAKVILITMHNTKGLEFDRVLVTGLEEGLFPREEIDPQEIEEERRLFYVAITRACKELHFTSCRRRILHGRFMDQYPSRFLGEIPPEHSEVSGEARKPPAYTRGTGVYHEDYGTGVVVSTWNDGGEFVVKVQFESGRSGIFLPAYTPLEKVGTHDW